jgi:hypothetical protein
MLGPRSMNQLEHIGHLIGAQQKDPAAQCREMILRIMLLSQSSCLNRFRKQVSEIMFGGLNLSMR